MAKKWTNDWESTEEENEERNHERESLAKILVSTTSISKAQVLGPVFGLVFVKEGWLFRSKDAGNVIRITDVNTSYEEVVLALKAQCRQLGGNAVMGCSFGYRVATDPGLLKMLPDRQAVELFGYGTAARIAS